MKDAHKPDHKKLNTLIVWLKEGRFIIPYFLREFEWQPWDINEQMRAIILDNRRSRYPLVRTGPE